MLDAQDATTDGTAPTEAEPAHAGGPSLADELNALLIRTAVATRNAVRAREAEEEAKAEAVKVLRRGSTQMATNPLKPEEEFVQVTVSKATYSAEAEDRPLTEGWVRERYADKLEKKTRLIGTATEQDVMNVLRTFAPYLLEEVEFVPDHVIRELELKSAKARQPMGWGGEVGDDAPPGIVVRKSNPQVKVTFRNLDVVDDLILNGVVDLEGNMLGGGR